MENYLESAILPSSLLPWSSGGAAVDAAVREYVVTNLPRVTVFRMDEFEACNRLVFLTPLPQWFKVEVGDELGVGGCSVSIRCSPEGKFVVRVAEQAVCLEVCLIDVQTEVLHIFRSKGKFQELVEARVQVHSEEYEALMDVFLDPLSYSSALNIANVSIEEEVRGLVKCPIFKIEHILFFPVHDLFVLSEKFKKESEGVGDAEVIGRKIIDEYVWTMPGSKRQRFGAYIRGRVPEV